MKKKWLFWTSVVITIFILVIVVFLSYNLVVPKEANYENYYDYFVEKVRCHERLIYSFDSIESNANNYISKYYSGYDQLLIEKGWELNYYDSANNPWYPPTLFVRKSSQDKESLLRLFKNRGINKYCDSIKILDHIQIIDGEKGFYQFLIFAIIVDDFNKPWISDYYYIDVICSKRALNQSLKRCDIDSKIKFYKRACPGCEDDLVKKKRDIENLNYLPIVTEFNDSIIYKLIVYDHARGYFEKTFSITRNFPHNIKLINDSLLIEYDCEQNFL